MLTLRYITALLLPVLVSMLSGCDKSSSSTGAGAGAATPQNAAANAEVSKSHELTRVKLANLDKTLLRSDFGRSLAIVGEFGLDAQSDQVRRVQAYLCSYGYLKPDSFAQGKLDPVTSTSIKLYQKSYKLPETGIVDRKTVLQMAEYRCALPDDFITAAVRCPWKKSGPMRYFFANFSKSVSPADCRSAIVAAFATWRPFVPFDFKEVGARADADVEIAWIEGQDADIPMQDNISAHSDWPSGDLGSGGKCCYVCPTDGVMPLHFNERACDFVIGAEQGKFDLQTDAVHEVGHLIGMMHSAVPSAVMYSGVYPDSIKRALDADDLAGIRQLYPLPPPP